MNSRRSHNFRRPAPAAPRTPSSRSPATSPTPSAGPPNPLRDADHDIRERRSAVPDPLGRPKRLGQRRHLQGAGGGRLLFRRQRPRHRDLHGGPAALHRRHQRRHRQFGRLGEATGTGLAPWSAYQALEWGPDSNQIWGKVDRRRPRRPRPSTTRCSASPSTTRAESSGTRTPPVPAWPPAPPAPSRWPSQRRPLGTAAHAEQRRRASGRADRLPGDGDQYRRGPVCGPDFELPDHRGQPPKRHRHA